MSVRSGQCRQFADGTTVLITRVARGRIRAYGGPVDVEYHVQRGRHVGLRCVDTIESLERHTTEVSS